MHRTSKYSSSLSDGRTPENVVSRLFKLIFLTLPVLVVFISAIAAHGQNYSVFYNLGSRWCCSSWTSPMIQGRDGNLYLANGGSITQDEGIHRITPAGKVSTVYLFNTIYLQALSSTPILGTDGNLYGTTRSGGAYGMGSIFRLTPGGNVTVVYDFSGGWDGFGPHDLIQGLDGDLYGTTGLVWPNTGASIFRVTPTGALTVLYSFNYPEYASLILRDDDGNFYGAAGGGSYPNGMLFKITPSGSFTVIYQFDGLHGSTPTSLVQMDGYLVGTTFYGGSYGGGTIFKLTPAGLFTVVHEFGQANLVEGYGPYAVIRGSDGNVYGIAMFGGSGVPRESGTLFRIAPDGKLQVLHTFSRWSGQAPSAISQHTNGTFYGSTSMGGTGAHHMGVLFRFNMGLQPFAKLESTLGSPGTRLGILGNGFSSSTQVLFNGVPASIQVVTAQYLVATVPQGARTGYVKVLNASGMLTSDRLFTVKP